jgi:hypothetical protein
VLDELVAASQLAWTFDIEGDSLLITNREDEEARLLTRIYDVSDLPSYRDKHGEGVPDYDAIIDVITSSVAPTTWDDVGGIGRIGHFARPGVRAIIISHTWQTHLKIESLLADLRRNRARAPSKESIEKLPPLPTNKKPKVSGTGTM